jgi:hypothetical protein
LYRPQVEWCPKEHQPTYENLVKARAPVCFGHPEWQEKTADNSGGSGSTTWQIRRKYSPEKLAGCGVTSGSFLMISPNLHDIWVMFFLNLSQELKLVLLLNFGTLDDGYSL